MSGSIQPYLAIRQFPTGRRIFSFRGMRKEAVDLTLSAFVTFLDECIEKDRETLGLEARWEREKGDRSTARGEATVVDMHIDRELSAIQTIANAQAAGPDGDPDVQTARAFVKEVFPFGLAALTQLSFEEQLEKVDLLLGRFDGDLAAAVDTIGVRRQVDRLKPLVGKFRVELEKEKKPLTFDKVVAARNAGQERLARAVVRALAAFDGSDPESTEKREALLAEVNRQERLLAEARLRRRVVRDVDPDTGEETGPVLEEVEAA